MHSPTLYQVRTVLSRRLGVATLAGLCLSLILRATLQLCVPLAVLFVPGIIGSIFFVGLPPCGPQPPTDPARDLTLIVATMLNGIFYGGIFLAGFFIWAERRFKRENNGSISNDCVVPPQYQAKPVGSLLEYDS